MSDCLQDAWRLYRLKPSVENRNRLAELYLPVVGFIAGKIHARLPDCVQGDPDDLVGAGCIGLMQAIPSFDPGRGVKFESFCSPRIFGAICDQLRADDRLSRHARKRAAAVEAAIADLAHSLGRRPLCDEIAAAVGLPSRKCRVPALTSLDMPMGNGDVKGMLADQVDAPGDRLWRLDLLRLVTRGLSRNERLIIILRYWDECTFAEIGREIGLTESRVSQIHADLLTRLRSTLAGMQCEFRRKRCAN